jgi:hypothetical protein
MPALGVVLVPSAAGAPGCRSTASVPDDASEVLSAGCTWNDEEAAAVTDPTGRKAMCDGEEHLTISY